MKLKSFFFLTILAVNLQALTVGEFPKNITISGDKRGLVEDGKTWDSMMLRDKVYIMFYVDPDEKGVNEHYSAALKEKNYSKTGKFASIAIINLTATWKPNFVIESILQSKQEEFPSTLYVKDKASVLVKEWKLEDDAPNILIFAKDGHLLFYKSGKMSDEDMKNSFKIIEENL